MKSLKHPPSQSLFIISGMPWFLGNSALGIHVSCDAALLIAGSIIMIFIWYISFLQVCILGEGAWRGPLESNS